jgi:glycosyltransferase involved in cell wall biosynthesis
MNLNELTSHLIGLFLIYVFGKYFSYLVSLEFLKKSNKNVDKKYTENLYNKKISKKKKVIKNKYKIGLLTNEIPPIRYGGVATWIVNWIKMFESSENYEVVPIFLAYLDKPDKSFFKKYKNIRIIYKPEDITSVFSDIDICVNNLWIALDTVKLIKKLYPNIKMLSVCHSLIKMEHITNLGSKYTTNFLQQELTFMYSDYVILISKAERDYYIKFGYDKYKAKPVVIYNSYIPKFDNLKVFDSYNNNNVGYIGRHVPRKRPELPIFAVTKSKREDISVFNMGVDFSKSGNNYWTKLGELYKKQLNIIPFSSDKSKINKFWSEIGVNSITGIYEPFGYTICETLDRRVPAIVQDLDGPKEIIGELKDNVFTYKVEQDIEKDIANFLDALKKFWDTDPKVREEMAERARKALDKFRPEVIKLEWEKVLDNCLVDNKKFDIIKEIEDSKYEFNLLGIYNFLNNFKFKIMNTGLRNGIKKYDSKEIEI